MAQQQQLFNPMLAAAAMGHMGMNPAMMGMMNPTLPVDDDVSDDDNAPLSTHLAAAANSNADEAAVPPAKAGSGAPGSAPAAPSSSAAPLDPAAAAASQAWANLAQTRAGLYQHNGREDKRINRGTATFRAMPKAWRGVTVNLTG